MTFDFTSTKYIANAIVTFSLSCLVFCCALFFFVVRRRSIKTNIAFSTSRNSSKKIHTHTYTKDKQKIRDDGIGLTGYAVYVLAVVVFLINASLTYVCILFKSTESDECMGSFTKIGWSIGGRLLRCRRQ